MPPALLDTQLDIVKTMLTGKFDQGRIADAVSCSIRQVKKIKKNIPSNVSILSVHRKDTPLLGLL